MNRTFPRKWLARLGGGQPEKVEGGVNLIKVRGMTLKSLIIALMYCWSIAVWAADPWCSERGADVFKFEWVPKDEKDSQFGSVKVEDALTGETLQVLENVDNYYGNGNSLSIKDLNNDGCGDLVVLSSVAGIGNETSTVFLYDRESKRFIYSDVLSEIGGLDIDSRNKNCVVSFWKGGAEDIYTAQYCWSKGKLLKKNEYSVSPIFGEDGAVKCYEHVETTYMGDKKKTKKTCTKEF